MSKPQLGITDHALLRWMERAHGIDVCQWRALMAQAIDAALDDYHGVCPEGSPAVIIVDNRVITYLDAGYVQAQDKKHIGVAVPMA